MWRHATTTAARAGRAPVRSSAARVGQRRRVQIYKPGDTIRVNRVLKTVDKKLEGAEAQMAWQVSLGVSLAVVYPAAGRDSSGRDFHLPSTRTPPACRRCKNDRKRSRPSSVRRRFVGLPWAYNIAIEARRTVRAGAGQAPKAALQQSVFDRRVERRKAQGEGLEG